MKRLKYYLIKLLLLIAFHSVYAIDSISIGGGTGKPDNLQGGRVAVQWFWNNQGKPDARVHVTGYWDASIALWTTNGDHNRNHKRLTIIAIAPIFRVQFQSRTSNYIVPFLEGSVGLAALSNDRIGHRDLGGPLTFQDFLGGGIRFGEQEHFEICYHYLHYSNAGLLPPNDGIDVKQYVTVRIYV